MSKASGSIDLKSLKVAGQTATNFLSVDNSGIMIYDGSNGTQTPSNPDVDTNNVFIDSDSLDIRKGTNVLATFSAEETRVGSYEGSNIRLGELGISAKKSGGSEYFNVGIIGNEQQYVSVSKDDTGRDAFAWLTGSGGSDEDFINLHSAIASGGVFGVSLKITVDYNTSSSDHRYSGTLTRTYKYEAFHKGTSYTYTKMNSSPNIEEARIVYSTYPNTNIWYVDAFVNSAFLDWYFDYGWRHARVVLKMYATVNTTAPAYSFGINTNVSKKLGFAIGNGTIPSEVGLAMGKYNMQDTDDDYVLIIGNGTSSTPSNALTVDWNGNVNASGQYENLYKITTVQKVISGGINANSYVAAANITMTAQSGYNAVGIVGHSSSNFRVQPTTNYVSNNTTIFAGFANWSASNVTSDVTVIFYVLWLKATAAS